MATVRMSGVTHRGGSRSRNEDSFGFGGGLAVHDDGLIESVVVTDGPCLAVVADGLGGAGIPRGGAGGAPAVRGGALHVGRVRAAQGAAARVRSVCCPRPAGRDFCRGRAAAATIRANAGKEEVSGAEAK